MAFTKDFAEMVAELNELLAPRQFSLAGHPGQSGKAFLTHPELEEVIRTRLFLNHGLGASTDSGIVLAMSPKKPELVLESYRELKRTTRERTDLIGVTLDDDGQLVCSRLSCAFPAPIPFPIALKVMSLGVARV